MNNSYINFNEVPESRLLLEPDFIRRIYFKEKEVLISRFINYFIDL